jgi:6-pyruvoyl-tetrahydropterin synthase
MRYQRTYHFQAAHFNSRSAYETAWAVVAQTEKKDASLGELPNQVTIFSIYQALCNVHGHNFKVVVDLEGGTTTEGWLLDDVALENIVMRYAGKNISMHPDFLMQKKRATTELIAAYLYSMIDEAFPQVRVVSVKVHETDDIFAVADEGDCVART